MPSAISSRSGGAKVWKDTSCIYGQGYIDIVSALQAGCVGAALTFTGPEGSVGKSGSGRGVIEPR